MRARTIAILTLATLPVSCSQGLPPSQASGPRTGAQAGMVRRHGGLISPGGWTGKNVIYWVDTSLSTAYVFSSKGVNGKEEGSFTLAYAYPALLFVDKLLNLYVSYAFGGVTVYKPGATSPFLAITHGIDMVSGITVDAAGTVYCSNSGNDTITIYPKGATSPSRTIDTAATPAALATDAHDNLYSVVGKAIYEFAKGASKGKNLKLNVGTPYSLEVDRSGNLIVVDASRSEIDVFPPGKTHPSKRVAVTSGKPYRLSLSADNTQLYVSELTISSSYIVQVLDYPKGTKLKNKLTLGGLGQLPIAVSPDNVLGS